MAWEWSHTVEAYENARKNLEMVETDILIEILSEWDALEAGKVTEPDHPEPFFQEAYDESKERLTQQCSRLDGFEEHIADAIWTKAEELATCDNGGFNAWVCPYGCHTVSFDREDEENNE